METKEKDISNKIISALRSLGATPSDVAEKLQALSIKGIVNDGEHCPIANYLKSKDIQRPDATRIYVSAYHNGYYITQVCYNDHKLNHIVRFINDFDHGKYPKLEQKGDC